MSLLQKSNISDRLLRYSAAASLMGSGVILVGGQYALANGGGIIVTTPNYTINAGDALAINLDSDTGNLMHEFRIVVSSSSSSSYGIYLNWFQQGVQFRGASSQGRASWVFPIPLDQSDPIGSTGLWNGTGIWLTSSAWRGHWVDLSGIHYLGVRFTGDDAQTHYGWVELTVTDCDPGLQQVVVHRYAYDTTPNQTILAGSTTPTAVTLSSAAAAGSLQTAAAAALAAVGGALTWIRRKVFRA